MVKGLEKINNVVSVVNEKKKIVENQQKIIEMVETMEGIPDDLEIIQPARRLLFEGDLLKVSQGHLQERHFILFNGNYYFKN